jgi:CRISPR-associated protein Cas1
VTDEAARGFRSEAPLTEDLLWPARNVAEFAYCPRLFYYMEVEGIHLDSPDTEAGRHVHRRVDRPSAAPDAPGVSTPEDPDRPKSVRCLTLNDKALGLTATLDIAEIRGKVAIPVEYRKGHPDRRAAPTEDADDDEPETAKAPPEPWPTDRVQVALQALLLESAGYEVPEGVIYYSAEKLRLNVPMTSELRQEALRVLESAKKCASGPRPLPLVNDPRCVRCSLQPICLPDEVNQQRVGESAEELTPRKIWPPRDDGIHVVAQSRGMRIGVRGSALRCTDAKGALTQEIPLSSVDSLAVVGAVQLSTQALHVLADRGVPVAFLSAAGRLVAMVDPLDAVSANVRCAQVVRLGDERARLTLARALIEAKIQNQRTLLMRNHPSLPPTVASALAAEAEAAAGAPSVEVVRGHEGQAAAIYFEYLPGVFKGEVAEQFRKNGRERRPPPDPINACLSMAYSILTNECITALRLASLEPSIGAFHSTRPGRPALALDLLEPFRPIIADSVAVAGFNRGELTDGHFLRTAAGCALTDSGRRAFFGAYGRRMDAVVTHPVFEYRLSYRRMLMLHARMIAAWLQGEIPALSFLKTR